MKRKNGSSDDDDLETPTIQTQIENCILSSRYTSEQQERLSTYIDVLLKIFGKTKDSSVSHTNEKLVATIVYIACLRCNVDPPYNNIDFAKCIFRLQKSKFIQQRMDELILKKDLLDASDTVETVYARIFERGNRISKYIMVTFHTLMKETQNALIPLYIFNIITVVWSYISYTLACDVLRGTYDGRTAPLTISLICRLVHDCVENSPYKRFTSDDSSVVLDQLLDVLAGGKTALTQPKQFLFSPEIPGYEYLHLLLHAQSLTSMDWDTMAIKYKSESKESIEEYMSALCKNIVRRDEGKDDGKTIPFRAEPITTITIGNSWGF